MSDDSNADRRREPRVAARIAVRCTEPRKAAKAIRAFSINLSAGGMCLKTQRTYEPGARLELHLELEAEQLSVSGAVAWVRHGVIGVRFLDLSPTVREKLEALTRALDRPAPLRN